uniref:Uncharacterized protein n=1 Tax=Oncorhynchus kisutch TaxID=8019 RepID=A0A8C7DGF4_ONCKI
PQTGGSTPGMSGAHLGEWQRRSFDISSGTCTPEQTADAYRVHILAIQYAWASAQLSQAAWAQSLFCQHSSAPPQPNPAPAGHESVLNSNTSKRKMFYNSGGENGRGGASGGQVRQDPWWWHKLQNGKGAVYC